MLTQEQYLRYSRQLIIPEIRGEGQQKILEAKGLTLIRPMGDFDQHAESIA